MKLFECQHCHQPLYFESDKCDSCGRRIGYLAESGKMSALEPDGGDRWQALADPANRFRFCANAQYEVCNWMVLADSPEEFCAACRHNRTIPDLSVPQNVAHWSKIEVAKHRLFYTLLRLYLPRPTRTEDPEAGLAFDFLQALPKAHQPVLTGHASGLITLNLAEANDSERERQRAAMGEPYRTLLGHFRHEIAHYYWDILIRDAGKLDEFRRVFGNEQDDYQAALKEHYAKGAPLNWPQSFVTAYASSHPWEDFAETWTHYFHMVDTLETANAFGIRLRPKVAKSEDLATTVDFDPHQASLERIIDAWLPLTFAMNSINRSMGLSDLYPFVLGPGVIVKLSFIHAHIRACVGDTPAYDDTTRAVIAGLKRGAAQPVNEQQ